ncbi:MAG: hypothetical protein KAI66_05025 [Lentisphaeria bacterium]|nr:hypothetical protein [Lentisphaeria bacterium]
MPKFRIGTDDFQGLIEGKAYGTQLLEAGVQPDRIRKLAIVIQGKTVRVRQLDP